MFCHHTLQEEQEQRNDDYNHAQGRREMIVRTDFAHELCVNQDRERFKSFPNQHRRTKIGEHPHKDQQRTCQQ